MKDNLKVHGFEALYLLAMVIVACISSLMQLVGRKYVGEYSSFIFSGNNYEYNIFFYFLGLAVFIGLMFILYKYFLNKKISGLSSAEIGVKVVFPIIALLFSALMLIAILVILIVVSGFDNMLPESMFEFTLFGWPIICMVYMIFVEVTVIKNGNRI